MANFLKLNNFEIPVQDGSVSIQTDLVGRTSRSAEEQYSSSTRYKKRTISATTTPMPYATGRAVEQLILGSGTHATFDDGIHSSGGVGPSFSPEQHIPKPSLYWNLDGPLPCTTYVSFGAAVQECLGGKILLTIKLRGDFDQITTTPDELARIQVNGYSIPVTDAANYPTDGYDLMTENYTTYWTVIEDLDVTALIGRDKTINISYWGPTSSNPSLGPSACRFEFNSPLLNGGTTQVHTLTGAGGGTAVDQNITLVGRDTSAVYCNQTLFGENDWTILAYDWTTLPNEWQGIAGVGTGQTVESYYRYGTDPGSTGLQPTASDFHNYFTVMGGPWGDLFVGDPSGSSARRFSDVTFLPYKATPEMIAAWKDIRTQPTHLYPFSPLPRLFLSGEVIGESATPAVTRPHIEVYGTIDDADFIQGNLDGAWHDNLVVLSFTLDEV